MWRSLFRNLSEKDALSKKPWGKLTEEQIVSLWWDARYTHAENPEGYQMLFAILFQRGDYKKGAKVMHEYYERLGRDLADKMDERSLELQLQALKNAILALSALGEGDTTFVYHHEKLAENGQKQLDARIVTLRDLELAYSQLEAHKELLSVSESDLPIPLQIKELRRCGVEQTLGRLAQNGFYDLAFSLGKMHDHDLSCIFTRLAETCVSLQRDGPDGIRIVFPAWSGEQNLIPRAWSMLEKYLQDYDSPRTNFRYSLAAARTILEQDAYLPLPQFVIDACLRNGDLERNQTRCMSFVGTGLAGLVRLLLTNGMQLEGARMFLEAVKSEGYDGNDRYNCEYIPYELLDEVLHYCKARQDDVDRKSTAGTRLAERLGKVTNEIIESIMDKALPGEPLSQPGLAMDMG